MAHTRGNFGVEACTRSLEKSLRDLGTDRIDFLLLHDPQTSDVDETLLEWLLNQKQRGTIINAGVAVTANTAVSILRQHADSFEVAQVPSNVLSPSLGQLREVTVAVRVTHGVISEPLGSIKHRLEQDRAWGHALSECANVDLTEPGALARLLLAWAIAENREGIVLVGTSNADHLRSAPQSLREVDTAHLTKIGQFLRNSFAD
jgi:aryl-alcohol dehydrogenase-like predicted oxidoreductase